jgi:hypothetical protein
MAPAIKIVDVQFIIAPSKIQIRLEGSLVTKIAELFTKLFKEIILTQVVENIKKEIHKIVDEDINQDLLLYGSHT